MASTAFVDNSSIIYASWLNDVNSAVYNGTFISPTITPTNIVCNGSVSGTGFNGLVNNTLTSPGAIGNGTPNTGSFTTLSTSGLATLNSLSVTGSTTLVTPNLGTPSTLVGTNISGTAANLTAGVATNTSALNATCATYLTGNAIGSYICTNYNVTPNGLGYAGTWVQYNATNSSGQNTLYGWIRTA